MRLCSDGEGAALACLPGELSAEGRDGTRDRERVGCRGRGGALVGACLPASLPVAVIAATAAA